MFPLSIQRQVSCKYKCNQLAFSRAMESLLFEFRDQSSGSGTGFGASTEVLGAGLLSNLPFCGGSVITAPRLWADHSLWDSAQTLAPKLMTLNSLGSPWRVSQPQQWSLEHFNVDTQNTSLESLATCTFLSLCILKGVTRLQGDKSAIPQMQMKLVQPCLLVSPWSNLFALSSNYALIRLVQKSENDRRRNRVLEKRVFCLGMSNSSRKKWSEQKLPKTFPSRSQYLLSY